MRVKLVEMGKAKLLSENQMAAVKSLHGVPLKDWTEEQCNQIRNIYESIGKK